MQATEVLMNEHRVIEQVLLCLDNIAAEARRARKLDGDAARQALDFLRNFADRCHHGKEEEHLFPMMEARGFPRQGGPTGVMFHEHEEGRAHIQTMHAALEQAEAGTDAALQQFVQHAQAYVTLLREHIVKEDHCLFPMADRTLTAADQRQLLDSFTHVEHEKMGAGTHEHFLVVAQQLAERYGVSATPVLACGCGHGKH